MDYAKKKKKNPVPHHSKMNNFTLVITTSKDLYIHNTFMKQ